MTKTKPRCTWTGDKDFYNDYHDNEWGVPLHDDQRLFEMLILEGAQAGLSWETVLKKRPAYRKAFLKFDPKKVAKMTDTQLTALLSDPGIIRNRLKVFAARKNAIAFLEIQKEFGTFDKYLWSFVGGKQLKRTGAYKHLTHSPESDALSKDLKKRGMTFVGTTIMYAYMQAVGMVDDHMPGCYKHKKRQ